MNANPSRGTNRASRRATLHKPSGRGSEPFKAQIHESAFSEVAEGFKDSFRIAFDVMKAVGSVGAGYVSRRRKS